MEWAARCIDGALGQVGVRVERTADKGKGVVMARNSSQHLPRGNVPAETPVCPMMYAGRVVGCVVRSTVCARLAPTPTGSGEGKALRIGKNPASTVRGLSILREFSESRRAGKPQGE
jgi:hypothetical protein